MRAGRLCSCCVVIAAGALLLAACSRSSEPKAKQPPAAAETAHTPTAPAESETPEMIDTLMHTLSPDHASTLAQTPVATLDDEPSSLAAFAGKALLVVNVVSKCGLTPQYTKLEALQKQYADRGFTVVGFPCNQFGGQEPGTAEEIKTFCATKYGISFPMMEKIEVNGDGRHAIYGVLTSYTDTDGDSGDVKWNFEKFVVSADRTKVARFRPKTEPDDAKLIEVLEASF